MIRLPRRDFDPKFAQGLAQAFLELGVDLFEEFALLVVNQRRLLAVVDRDCQYGACDIATPTARTQRFRKLVAQALRNGQL